MRISEHFKVHGAIHAFWLLSVLLAIIAGLLIGIPNGVVVRDYVSFAAAIASLVLAMVAIFYSVIANQSFSEAIGSLKGSTDNIQTAARNISDTSSALSEQSERMIGEISGLPPAFKEISDKIDALGAPQATAPQPLDDKGQVDAPTIVVTNASSHGIRVGFYVLARSIETGKPIETAKIFEKGSEWDVFIAGMLHTIRTIRPLGMTLNFISKEKRFIFTVRDKGLFDPIAAMDSMASTENDTIQNKQAEVDLYFAEAADTVADLDISREEEAANSGNSE